MSTPLLIISDSPSCTSGLGRITRELANRLHEHCSDVFRVGVLGYGGAGSRHLAYPQYQVSNLEDWVLSELPIVWDDFAGGEQGIIFTIWDASRLEWLVDPKACPDPKLARWLATADRFKRWMYLPLDATGVGGRLPHGFERTIAAFDRVVCYSKWAEGVVRNTLPPFVCDRLGLTSLPHGIDTSQFQPKDKAEARRRLTAAGFKLDENSFLVGVVATNQARKDFGLAFATCAELMKQGLNVRMWIHTDRLKHYWDLAALAQDFGLQGKGIITTENLTDEQMSQMYSACDVTLGIGLGEGWGLPLAESIACGTPVVHGTYAGGAEFLPAEFLVGPVAWKVEGQFNCMRPVFEAVDWVECARRISGITPVVPEYIKWTNAWPKWEAWFREGVKCQK